MRTALIATALVFLGMAFAATRQPEAQTLHATGTGVDVRALTLAAGPLPEAASDAN
jgi:hypothetical protein